MKRTLIVMGFSILQAACATTVTNEDASRHMLTFQQIGAEISVQHEMLEPSSDLDSTTAMNTVRAD